MKKYVFSVYALLAVHFSGPVVVARDKAWLDGITSTYKKTDGFHLDLRIEEKWTRPKDGATSTMAQVIAVRKDGGRWSILSRETGETWLLPKSVEHSVCQELVMDGSQAISIRARDERKYSSKRYPGPEMVPLPKEARELILHGSVDGSPPLQEINPQDYLNAGQFILGYVDPWIFLPDILASATEAEDVSVQIPGCIVVRQVGSKGRLTAWLDARNGFLPRRIEHQRKEGDILGEKDILGQIPAMKPGRIWPAAKLIATDVVIDRIEIEKLGDRPITTGFRIQFNYKYVDGQELLVVNEVAGSNLRESGRDAFTPVIAIPDGSRVQVSSTPQINYAWRGGRIEPETSPGAFGMFEGLARPGGSSWRRGYVGLIVLTTFALGILALTWWRRRAG